MSVLLNILLVCIIVYYLSKWFVTQALPRLLMWWMHKQARQQYEQMYGQKPPSGSRRQRQSQQQQAHAQRRRRSKIINKDVGEYVDFEEIPTYNHSDNSQSNAEAKGKKYQEESQISDAEWEDL